jgi:hypothetical protein
VHVGLDGSTGAVLASATVPRTGVCSMILCGDPHGEYGRWNLFRPCRSRALAKSVRFTGPVRFVMIDDVTIILAEPTSTKTTYWLWDPTTNAQVGELLNNSVSCIAAPYNIEVRPCSAPGTWHTSRAPPSTVLLFEGANAAVSTTTVITGGLEALTELNMRTGAARRRTEVCTSEQDVRVGLRSTASISAQEGARTLSTRSCRAPSKGGPSGKAREPRNERSTRCSSCAERNGCDASLRRSWRVPPAVDALMFGLGAEP